MIKINLKQVINQYNNESSLGHKLHKKLTLRKLHQFTGVSVHALSDIYNGNVKSIKLDNLNRLVSFFGGNILNLISFVPDIKQIIFSGTLSKPTLSIITNDYSCKLSVNLKINSSNFKNINGACSINTSILFTTIKGNSVKNSNLINSISSNNDPTPYLSNNSNLIASYLLVKLCPQIPVFHHEHSNIPLATFSNILVDHHELQSNISIISNDKYFNPQFYSSQFYKLPFKITNNFAK